MGPSVRMLADGRPSRSQDAKQDRALTMIGVSTNETRRSSGGSIAFSLPATRPFPHAR
jgi:hypothetical protein